MTDSANPIDSSQDGSGPPDWAKDVVAEAAQAEGVNVDSQHHDGEPGSDVSLEVLDDPALDKQHSDSGSEGETKQNESEVEQDGGSDPTEQLSAERDELLALSKQLKADFDNYKKQVAKRESDQRLRANENLVRELLPVLDACDAALDSGAEDVAPIASSLTSVLSKLGLKKLDATDEPFDPKVHEAVMHDEGEASGPPTVIEVLRAGYIWGDAVVRPAMVRVKG